MPTQKVPGGYKWGNKGKVYPTKAEADKQGAAIKISQMKEAKKRGKGPGYKWRDKNG